MVDLLIEFSDFCFWFPGVHFRSGLFSCEDNDSYH